MAHFAELDKNNIVTRVVCVSDVDTCNQQGYEVESVGQQFLKNMYGQETRWVKTSYNARIRKNYAGIGYEYNEELDAFIPPKPYDSWVLDKENYRYTAPIPCPDKEGKVYFWNENDKVWIENDYVVPQ